MAARLTASALLQNAQLESFEGRVSDSGRRWTVKAAIDAGFPTGTRRGDRTERFSSRGADDFADRLLSAMRYEFGGHKETNPR